MKYCCVHVQHFSHVTRVHEVMTICTLWPGGGANHTVPFGLSKIALLMAPYLPDSCIRT